MVCGKAEMISRTACPTKPKDSQGPRKHFDLALDRYLQREKIELCPQLCPRAHWVRERSRMAISDMGLGGRGWYSVRLRILDYQPVSGKLLVVR